MIAACLFNSVGGSGGASSAAKLEHDQRPRAAASLAQPQPTTPRLPHYADRARNLSERLHEKRDSNQRPPVGRMPHRDR